jgi:hypothetical protein
MFSKPMSLHTIYYQRCHLSQSQGTRPNHTPSLELTRKLSVKANMTGTNVYRRKGAKLVFDGVELTSIRRPSARQTRSIPLIPSLRPQKTQSCELDGEEAGYYGGDDEMDIDEGGEDDTTGSVYLPSDLENDNDVDKTSAANKIIKDRGIPKQRNNNTSKPSQRTRHVTSSKTYPGIAPRTERELKNEPAFKLACRKQHHRFDEDPSAAISAPCVDACPLMALFDMYYCRLGIVCRRCHCLVPVNQLPTHLHKYHARTAGTYRISHYQFVATHIVQTHNLTEVDPVLNSPELSEPVSGLETPRRAHKCPYCPNKWIAVYKGPTDTYLNQAAKMRFHIRKDHADKDIPSRFICRYIVRPYWYIDMRDRVLVFTDGWEPNTLAATNPGLPSAPAQNVYRREPHTEPSAKFLEDLGWPQYIGNMHASNDRLRRLVQRPSQLFAKSRKSKRTRYLELGLCAIYSILLQYFREANTFAGSRYSQTRQAFVHK